MAHRLNTLLDYDEILVLSHGELVEQGHPHELMKRPNGPFSLLLKGEKAEHPDADWDADVHSDAIGLAHL